MIDPKLQAAYDAMNKGDVKPLVAIGVRSAFSDERCVCDQPHLTGRALMCGKCLKRNQGQIDALEALMRGSHPFEIDRVSHPRLEDLGMCSLCSGWRDDKRHAGKGEHSVYGDWKPGDPA